MAKIRTEQEGRVCNSPECTTVLSVYNSKPQCWAHEHEASVDAAEREHRRR